MTPRKHKEAEDKVYMEWLRVNRPDKWRKIQRMKLEREHDKRKKERRDGDII